MRTWRMNLYLRLKYGGISLKGRGWGSILYLVRTCWMNSFCGWTMVAFERQLEGVYAHCAGNKLVQMHPWILAFPHSHRRHVQEAEQIWVLHIFWGEGLANFAEHILGWDCSASSSPSPSQSGAHGCCCEYWWAQLSSFTCVCVCICACYIYLCLYLCLHLYLYFYLSQESGAGSSSHEYWWAHLWLSSAVFAQCHCQPLSKPIIIISNLIILTNLVNLVSLITRKMNIVLPCHGPSSLRQFNSLSNVTVPASLICRSVVAPLGEKARPLEPLKDWILCPLQLLWERSIYFLTE